MELNFCYIHANLYRMKITELKRVPKAKIGKYHKNGIKPESHEEKVGRVIFDLRNLKKDYDEAERCVIIKAMGATSFLVERGQALILE